jgi:hypothetical protein
MLPLCEVSFGVSSVIYVRVAMFTIFSARNSHRIPAGSRPKDGGLSTVKNGKGEIHGTTT